jgi:hypothetical protein
MAGVQEVLQLQDDFRKKEEMGLDEFLLDPQGKEKRQEETALNIICDKLFLSQKEIEMIMEKGKYGEAAKQILGKLRELTEQLVEKAQITHGEKRFVCCFVSFTKGIK